MIDSRNISDLHPTLQRGANELIRRMKELGYPVGISSTYRDNEAQDYLYAQGRTRPGAIVTNARAGDSMHNYKLAFDIFKNIKGYEYSDYNFFDTAGRIWTEMGGEWGGSWTTFVDKPHMQFTGGLSLADLKAGKRLANDAKMYWETKIEDMKKPEGDEHLQPRFNFIHELPYWAEPTISKLMRLGYLKGDEKGRLNLSEDMVRILVINDRAGLYK
ncbi:MAG: M15 family metallopeptidase [Defluviitaleaceae bacterium]|nr:M15 family metallopeptidase [Defluviitaleaceae bacterium]